MVSIGYLVANVGLLDESDLEHREQVANDLVEAVVAFLESEWGPKVIESETEEELAVPGMLRLLSEHEEEYDAFVVGCFGDPGLMTFREFTDKPIVGPAMASYHTAAQIAGGFSILNIVERTEPLMHRIVNDYHLADRVTSVRTLGVGVDEIDHDDDELARNMISTGRVAVEEDGAGALIPGCMGLSFMQVHEDIADELGVPFLDPVTLALETARTWTRHGITQSPTTSPKIDRERLEFLLTEENQLLAD